jgi:hypothetical protein
VGRGPLRSPSNQKVPGKVSLDGSGFATDFALSVLTGVAAKERGRRKRPHPYGTATLLRSGSKKYLPVKGGLASPWGERHVGPTERGRRKRPHPSSPQPPPLHWISLQDQVGAGEDGKGGGGACAALVLLLDRFSKRERCRLIRVYNFFIVW